MARRLSPPVCEVWCWTILPPRHGADLEAPQSPTWFWYVNHGACNKLCTGIMRERECVCACLTVTASLATGKGPRSQTRLITMDRHGALEFHRNSRRPASSAPRMESRGLEEEPKTPNAQWSEQRISSTCHETSDELKRAMEDWRERKSLR